MRYKTKEVEKYQPRYKVFDKTERKFSAEFEELYEAIVFCEVNADVQRWNVPKISYTLKAEPEYEEVNTVLRLVYDRVIRTYQTVYHPAAKYVIFTDLGDIVSEDEVNECRRMNRVWKSSRWGEEWWEYCYKRNSRLVSKKGSPKKIKNTYKLTYRGLDNYGHDFYSPVGYYRRVRSKAEKKQACAHQQEYGDSMVRAKRRYKNLPDTYDDYTNDIWNTRKSWKHNSKRRKQWVPK